MKPRADLLSPGGSPGISDDPIVLSGIGTIAHNGNSMVEGVWVAEHGLEHTTLQNNIEQFQINSKKKKEVWRQ
jgi:hypothetical protein